jgi:hypothetical protein
MANGRKRRIPVGTLTDIAPIAEQVEPYYLLRERTGYQYAPLELVPEREMTPPGRPSLTPEEREDIRRRWEQGVGDYAALLGRSLRGSKRMTRAEVRRGYRTLSGKKGKRS